MIILHISIKRSYTSEATEIQLLRVLANLGPVLLVFVQTSKETFTIKS